MEFQVEEEPVPSIFDDVPEPEPEFHPVSEPEPDMPLQLTDSMMVEEQPQDFHDHHEPAPSFAPQQYQHDYTETLVSDAAAAASGASIAQLANAVARERAVALGNQGITLEQLVREICTPLLKQWLDSNLPYMVERIVKQEIERIATRSDRM
jgi:cell pole-organizing protein PopZ